MITIVKSGRPFMATTLFLSDLLFCFFFFFISSIWQKNGASCPRHSRTHHYKPWQSMIFLHSWWLPRHLQPPSNIFILGKDGKIGPRLKKVCRFSRCSPSIYLCTYHIWLQPAWSHLPTLRRQLIKWIHNLAGLHSPTDNPMVKLALQGFKRVTSSPTLRKHPITPDILTKIYEKYGHDHASLADLRVLFVCFISYAGFLRFDDLKKYFQVWPHTFTEPWNLNHYRSYLTI